MSDIDFQNGFIVGMATRGITRSGLQYEPLVWNDEGVYSYFYIDFKQPVAPFSLGMLSESIIIHDSEQLTIIGFEKVSTSVCKIIVDISGRTKGVTVVNKKSSMLEFATGESIPPFAVFFFVSGLDSYFRRAFAYGEVDFNEFWEACLETTQVAFGEYFALNAGASESVDYTPLDATFSESTDISYWTV